MTRKHERNNEQSSERGLVLARAFLFENKAENKKLTAATELSHQLHELGTEIESLVKTADESASREALEQLRVNQIRIANEQARYEIAFRQDLAEVIEQIRKTK